jgi:hypothetical protein
VRCTRGSRTSRRYLPTTACVRYERQLVEERAKESGQPLTPAEIQRLEEFDAEDLEADELANELIEIATGTAGKPVLSPSGTPWPRGRRW